MPIIRLLKEIITVIKYHCVTSRVQKGEVIIENFDAVDKEATFLTEPLSL